MTTRHLQRHDQFFYRLLEQPEAAGALLRERLPPEIVALLSDKSPVFVPGIFVSPRLRAYRTDRLFRTETVTGRPAFILTLLEHKAQPDQRTPLQLLGYQAQILEDWARKEGTGPDGKLLPLPALVTLVVYNGTEEWNVPLTLAEITDADAAIRPWLMDFRYSLVSLGNVPDSRLSAVKVLRVGLLIMKHGRPARKDRHKLIFLMRQAHNLSDEDLITLVYYLLGDPKGPNAAFIQSILSKLFPEQGETIMTTAADQLKAEGFSKGALHGHNEGKKEMLLRLLQRRFAPLSPEIEARVRGAEIAQLDEWSERLIDGNALPEIFAPARTH